MSSYAGRVAVSAVLIGTLSLTSGCLGHAVVQPVGADSPRAAATEFLHALERHDEDGMRRLMSPLAQQDESISGGLLDDMPELTGFTFLDHPYRENPHNNASPKGSLASWRYVVALTPPDGFDRSGGTGTAYLILVAELPDQTWVVAELGGDM